MPTSRLQDSLSEGIGRIVISPPYPVGYVRWDAQSDQDHLLVRQSFSTAFQFAAEYSFWSKARPATRESCEKHRVFACATRSSGTPPCWPTILDSQQETSSAIPSAAFAQRGAHFLLWLLSDVVLLFGGGTIALPSKYPSMLPRPSEFSPRDKVRDRSVTDSISAVIHIQVEIVICGKAIRSNRSLEPL